MSDVAVNESTTTKQAWDASQCEAALAHLERLQEQLDSLRSAIPSVVAPLLRPAASRAQMFAEVKKAALQSIGDLGAFRENWTSEQTQRVLTQSKESLGRDGDLSKAGLVARYGWSEQ